MRAEGDPELTSHPWEAPGYINTATMDGNNNHQQQQQQLQERATASTASANPPLRPPSTSLPEGTTESPSSREPPTSAAASNQDFFQLNNWSLPSASASLSPDSGNGEHPDAPQPKDVVPPSQVDHLEQPTPGPTPGKRKRPSIATEATAPSDSPNPTASEQSPQTAPKKPRRGKAAGKGRNNSIAGEEKESIMSAERPRLSEQEKKNNHIASEQKRRMAIREGFDRLTEIVPGLEGQGRSESVVLRKSVDHMREVLQERQELIERIQALGGEIPPELQ